MSRARRSSVQKYHDRVADRYDQIYDDEYWRWHDGLTWDYLKPHLPRVARSAVIDLGCGTGKWGKRLHDSGFRVTCVDISARMLDQARQTFETADGTSRLSFVQADLCDLSALPAGEFSLAVALGEPIGCSRDPALAMREIRRILTDDGILVATLDNRLAAIEFYLQQGDFEAFARFLRDGKTHWLTRKTDERFPITTFDPSELAKFVERAGFRLIELLGKTVLPMRGHRHLLATPELRRQWAKVEKTICRDRFAIGKSAHLQIACQVAR